MSTIASMTDAELTEAVAREVMGWEIVATQRRVPGSGKTSWTWFDEKRGRRQFIDRDWSPLTDANAMMEVVERVAQDGVVVMAWHGQAVGTHRVEVITDPSAPGGAQRRGMACHQSLGRAVCEAALKATRTSTS